MYFSSPSPLSLSQQRPTVASVKISTGVCWCCAGSRAGPCKTFYCVSYVHSSLVLATNCVMKTGVMARRLPLNTENSPTLGSGAFTMDNCAAGMGKNIHRTQIFTAAVNNRVWHNKPLESNLIVLCSAQKNDIFIFGR